MSSEGGPTQSNGIHGAPGSAGAQTTGQPDPVSWGVLTGRPSAQQQTARVRCSAETGRRTREPETKGLFETGPRSDGRNGSSVCSPLILRNAKSVVGQFEIIASIEDPDVIPDASDRSDPEAPGAGSARGSTEPLTA